MWLFYLSNNVSSTLPTSSGLQIVTLHIRLNFLFIFVTIEDNFKRKMAHSQKQPSIVNIKKKRKVVNVNVPNFFWNLIFWWSSIVTKIKENLDECVTWLFEALKKSVKTTKQWLINNKVTYKNLPSGPIYKLPN